ncbi:MAG: class I SAM-dependent methyltransferase [Deltaproteobacteria bacterium]|nr:class I SAM-dependent methyltransferase [Deltaproteobacteria bacterium]MBI4224573.1 class I SAM-dependent methyltransferase [Deltaproteobacteria bacterium]
MSVKSIQSFWGTEACGSHFVAARPGTREFYGQYRAFRYRTEWHIPEWVPFAEAKGKKVLEIGCGNGADGVLFARAGAEYTGVDLTGTAVEAIRKHFEVEGLPGTFQIDNAEALSFPDASFDWVYSYGVLHHTDRPEKAFAEVFRVLKPGGRAYLMLYHKNSFNYYVRIMGYMRLRLLLKILKGQNGGVAPENVRGNQGKAVWDIHRQNFLKEGWRYLKAENFVHHATDGPDCPTAFVFTKAQAKKFFSPFQSVQCRVYHFPIRKYPAGRWVPRPVEAFLARHLGWYLCLTLEK